MLALHIILAADEQDFYSANSQRLLSTNFTAALRGLSVQICLRHCAKLLTLHRHLFPLILPY
jgi:hypothetical protein